MALGRPHLTFLLGLFILLTVPPQILAEGEILEFFCQSCGYRERFVQGANPSEEARNVQSIIVVCERSRKIRSIKIPVDPKLPVKGEPLLARQFGTGQSDLLRRELPKFLVPGNTCPLFPITAYLEQNICPVDGNPGLQFIVVGTF